MASQIEGGGGTASAASTELIKWLRENKLENQQLIELLTKEEIDSVDDLMVFKNSLGDEKRFTEILVSKGVKIGKISKLLKALNNYNPTSEQKNDDIKNQSLGSVIMLDTKEKEAIRLLSSKLLEIETKLKEFPQYANKLSSSKDALKLTINNTCNDWVKLINYHKQILFKWVEIIEQGELESNKLLKKKLNDELHLVEETKLKCQGLMSFASINDIWTPKQADINEQQPQENIVSLVTNCVDKLDKSLKIPKKNVFDQVKFMQFNKAKAQELLSQNINLFPASTLSVDVSDQTQVIKFTLETPKEFDLYSLRELFVKGVESRAKNTVDEEDEKKDFMDGITKLSMFDNQCSISFQELDNKLGRYLNYVAYIVEHLDEVNVATKREDIPFKIAYRIKEIKYTLNMSSKYNGPPNTQAALVNDDLHQGCGTQSLANSWIEVSFSNNTVVSRIEIAGPGDQMTGGWNVGHLNGKVLQYKDDKGSWIDIMTIQNLKQNVVESIKLDVNTTAMRVFNQNGYVAVGCWKVFGDDYK